MSIPDLTRQSGFKRVGKIVSNAMAYDARFDIKYFLEDGTDLFVRDALEAPEPSGSLSDWVFCTDGLPEAGDADPWGKIFVMQNMSEAPVMITLTELQEELDQLEDKSMDKLPTSMQFFWKRTGLTDPIKSGHRNKKGAGEQ